MKKIATLALCVLMLALTAPVIQAATPQDVDADFPV